MKITLLKSKLGQVGGLEKYTAKLSFAFSQKGCDVTILTTYPKGISPKIDNILIEKLFTTKKISYFQIKDFDERSKKWLEAHPSEVIFGMERNSFQTHLRAGSGVHQLFLDRRKKRASFLKKLSLNINPLHHLLLDIEKKAFEDPNLKCLFVNSQMVKEEILSYYSTQEDKIEVVYNGVEWHEMQKMFEKSLWNEKEPIQFLFVGNGYERKGLLFLIDALSEIKNEAFHLTVVGKDKNAAFFQKRAEKSGLKDKISFLGPQKEVLSFLQKSDVLVLPSLYDPFANITLEAISMGLFVVTSAFNGGKEILTAATGFVIEDLFSKESVIEAIKVALSKRKTKSEASLRRESIRHLDFSNQLDKIVTKTLNTI